MGVDPMGPAKATSATVRANHRALPILLSGMLHPSDREARELGRRFCNSQLFSRRMEWRWRNQEPTGALLVPFQSASCRSTISLELAVVDGASRILTPNESTT